MLPGFSQSLGKKCLTRGKLNFLNTGLAKKDARWHLFCVVAVLCYYTNMDTKNIFINPKALGEISKDLGQIFFASVFLTSLMGDTVNYFAVLAGLILSIVFWSIYVINQKY